MAAGRPQVHHRTALLILLFLGGFDAGRVVHAEGAPAGLAEKQVKSLGKVAPDAGRFVVSPNGQRLAYMSGTPGEKMRVVCDGKAGLPYEAFYLKICFSPDGTRFAYLARRVAKRVETSVFVCDGTEKPAHPTMRLFAFSPDSRHVAYVGPECAMVRDGKAEKFQYCESPVFSPDSRHLAFKGSSGVGMCIICDGKPEVSFNDVGDPVFLPNSRGFAYAAHEGEAWFVICAAGKLGPFKEVGRLVFSPDSSGLAFKACLKKWFVVHKNKRGPDFDGVGDPVLSQEGGRLAYTAKNRESWFVICDGKKGRGYSEVGGPVFSPDGKHLAYHATREGKTFVVCDGKESADYAEIVWVGFSPDSTHLAFAAGPEGKKSIVCDGLESAAHEMLLVPEHFCDVPGKLRYVVIDKAKDAEETEASLVEVDWPAGRTWEDAFKPPVK